MNANTGKTCRYRAVYGKFRPRYLPLADFDTVPSSVWRCGGMRSTDCRPVSPWVSMLILRRVLSAMHGTRCGLLLHTYRGLFVCVSVCMLVTTVSRPKTDKPIEVPFGVWTREAKEPRITWGPGSPREGALWGSYLGMPRLARRRYFEPYSLKVFRVFNCRILYGLYLPTVILTVIWYSITHSLFHSRLNTFLLCKSFPLQPFLSST